MSSAGHIFDMIARLKANKALLRSKKNYFKKSILRFKKGKKLQFKTVTKQKLVEIKDQIRSQSIKDKKRMIRLTILTIFLMSGVIWFLTLIIQNLD